MELCELNSIKSHQSDHRKEREYSHNLCKSYIKSIINQIYSIHGKLSFIQLWLTFSLIHSNCERRIWAKSCYRRLFRVIYGTVPLFRGRVGSRTRWIYKREGISCSEQPTTSFPSQGGDQRACRQRERGAGTSQEKTTRSFSVRKFFTIFKSLALSSQNRQS